MNAVGDFEREKRLVAVAASDIVQSGMIVGLGTGSTVGYLLPALAARRLDIRCVTDSAATERAARELGWSSAWRRRSPSSCSSTASQPRSHDWGTCGCATSREARTAA